QLGESVTEGTITQWFKAVGDEVAEDEPLFEVSTDKVDSEVPSPSSGFLAEILVEEGDTVDVGTKVAVLSDAPPGDAAGGGNASEEPGDEAEDHAQEPAGGGDASEEPAEDAGEDAQSAVEPEPTDQPVTDQQAADQQAGEDEGGGDQGPGGVPDAAASAAEGEALEAPKPDDPTKGAPEPDTVPSNRPAAGGVGPVLSPVVRRLLDEAGVDASSIKGTGIGGRITRADAEAHIRANDAGTTPTEAPGQPEGAGQPTAQQRSQPADQPVPQEPSAPTGGPPPQERSETAASPAPAPAQAPAQAVESRIPAGTDESVPLNKIRRITADHMVRSLEVSAHAYVSTEVDYEAVERARSLHKAAFKAEEGTSLTYLPFVARALVDALAEFPHVNASMGEERELVVHGSVHLGVAVDLDHEGLIVPVVHDAQDQRLRAIARQVAGLSERARSKGLTADDITGGTITITNIGSTANLFLLPIINQPQVVILSTDGVARRPVVVTDDHGNESIAIHSVGNLTLGWDHRAFDGAYAAQFLGRLRDVLETRDWESEL
ncbi:MAG: dihydrolipoamide acetyltransferase family protein, partial [Acidimicrobiales bacterium]